MDDIGEAVAVVAAIVVGYLVGSFPTAVLVARVATRGRVDIRQVGSGNPGAFNTLRQLGVVWGMVVVLGDGAKGVAAPGVGWLLAGDAGAFGAATAVIAGHIWPVFSHLRGGKGMATAGGAVLAVFPAFFPVELVVLALGVVAFRRAAPAMVVGMASWVVAASVWTAADWPNAWGPAAGPGLVAFSVLGAAMVVTKFALAARETTGGA